MDAVDSIKCGGGGGYNLSGSAFGAPSPAKEVNLDGPLEELLVSKNWKARVAAYKRLKTEYQTAEDEKDSVFKKYVSLFKKILGESNPAAQVEASEALKVWVDRAAIAADNVDKVLPGLVKKYFSSNKPATKANVEEIFSLYIEIGCGEAATKQLLAGMKAMNVKVVIAALKITINVMSAFGPKHVPYKLVTGKMPSMFNHRRGEVRELVQALACEVYKYVGDIFHEQVKNFKEMKKATLESVAKAFAALKPRSAVPTKLLRSEQGAGGAGGAAADGKGGKAKSAAAADPFSFVDAVDITKELSKNWLKEVFAPKWLDKKKKLDELIKLASVPKIKPAPMIGDITKALKKLLKDSNVIVRGCAIKSLGALAKGLRKDFKSQASGTIDLLLPWFKEKKMTVLAPLNACLDNYFSFCLGWSDVKEPVLTAAADKVPQVRQNAIAFCTRCIKSDGSKAAALKKVLKSLWGACLKLAEDREVKVRDETLKCMAALVEVFGERTMMGYMSKLENLDARKAAKVKKLASAATSSAPAGESASAAAAPATPPRPASRSSAAGSPGGKRRAAGRSKTSTPSRGGRKGSPARRSGSSKSPSRRRKSPARKSRGTPGRSSRAAGKSSSKKSAGKSEMTEAKPMDYEAAKEAVSGMLSGEILSNLESKKWKERVAAMDALLELVKGDGAADARANIGAMFSLFKKHPSFKDSNFQVNIKCYTVCAEILKGSEAAAARGWCLVPLGELLGKMSDRKIAPACRAYLGACVELYGPKAIFPAVKSRLAKVRNPKAIAGTIDWVVETLDEFGAGSTDVQQVIGYAREWIAHANKDIRSGAAKIFVSVYKQTGKLLLEKMLEGLKASVRADIQKQFDKIPESEVGTSTATRAVRDQDVAAAPKLDEIVPRVDISAEVTEKLIAQMGDKKKWQLRKGAMDEVAQMIRSANGRIKGRDGGLFAALKLRLSDSNKNLTTQALGVIQQLVEAMGSGSGKYASVIVEAIMKCFSDRKASVREAAAKALNKFITCAGISKLINYLPNALDNKNAREDILKSIQPQVSKGELKKSETRELVVPILRCLLDRTKEVRALAEQLVPHVSKKVGFKAIDSRLTGFKKAEKLSLEKILGKYRGDLLTAKPSEAADGGGSASKASAPRSSPGRQSRKPRASTGRQGAKATSSKRSRSKGPAEVDVGEAIGECPARDKARRVKRDARRMKGMGGEIDAHEIEDMKETLVKYLSPEFRVLFLSKEFPKFSKAVDLIENSLDDEKVYGRVVGVLDLMLKWVSWRLCDGKLNTTVCKTLLRFLKTLTTALGNNGYELKEGEAKNIIPSLLDRVSGHSMAKMRSSCREIIQGMCTIYKPQKIVQELTDAMDSKSKRVQAECLDEIGAMMIRYGLSTSSSPKKTILLMGKSVGSSDKGVREAALTAIGKIYQILDCNKDKIWKYFGGKGSSSKIPSKNQTMITERLKRVKPLSKSEAKPVNAARPAGRSIGSQESAASASVGSAALPSSAPFGPAPGDSSAAGESTAVDMKSMDSIGKLFTLDFNPSGPGADVGATSTPRINTYGSAFTAPSVNEDYTLAAVERKPMDVAGPAGASAYSPRPTTNPFVLNLDSPAADQRVEALRQIWLQVQDQGAMVFVDDADVLVEKVSMQISPPYQMRLCKYALNTLMEFWQNVEFASIIKFSTLKRLTRSLLTTLLDQSLRAIESGDKVIKALNVLALKVLENAKRTHAFGTLFELLSESITEDSEQLGDLIVKCLLKLTKVLWQTIQDIELDGLLQKMHAFFRAHPARSFRDGNDMRLRTVKKILGEVARLKGKEVRQIALNVSGDAGSEIVRLCNQFLGIEGSSGGLAAGASASPKRSLPASPSRPVRSVVPEGAGDDPRADQVARLFQKLHQAENAKAALEELYEFREANGDYDLSPHMDLVSRPFQAWIQRGFKRIQNRREAGAARKPTADYYKERLRAIRARAAQVKESSFGNLSYGGPSPTKPARPTQFTAPAATPGAAGGADRSISDLRSRLNGVRKSAGLYRAPEAKENMDANQVAQPAEQAAESTTGPSKATGGLASIRARLAAVRSEP